MCLYDMYRYEDNDFVHIAHQKLFPYYYYYYYYYYCHLHH